MDYSRLVAGFLKHVTEGDFILNYGCGTGSQALKIAAKGFDVVSVDSDVQSLTKAQRNARLESLPVRFMDSLTGLKDSTFDACLAVRADDLKGIARVLQKGGLLYAVGGSRQQLAKLFAVKKEYEYAEKQEHCTVFLARKR